MKIYLEAITEDTIVTIAEVEEAFKDGQGDVVEDDPSLYALLHA